MAVPCTAIDTEQYIYWLRPGNVAFSREGEALTCRPGRCSRRAPPQSLSRDHPRPQVGVWGRWPAELALGREAVLRGAVAPLCVGWLVGQKQSGLSSPT